MADQFTGDTNPLSKEPQSDQRRYPEPPIIDPEKARPEVTNLAGLMDHLVQAIKTNIPKGRTIHLLDSGEQLESTSHQTSMRMKSKRFTEGLTTWKMKFAQYPVNIFEKNLPKGPIMELQLSAVTDQTVRDKLEQWMKANPTSATNAYTRYVFNNQGDIDKTIWLPFDLAQQLQPRQIDERKPKPIIGPVDVPLRTIDLTYIGAAGVEMLDALGVPKESYSRKVEVSEEQTEDPESSSG